MHGQHLPFADRRSGVQVLRGGGGFVAAYHRRFRRHARLSHRQRTRPTLPAARGARQVAAADYERFDYVLAMDADNLELLARDCPPAHAAKLALFMRYGEQGEAQGVPDPYNGGTPGFEQVLDMVEDAAQGLLRHIRERYSL